MKDLLDFLKQDCLYHNTYEYFKNKNFKDSEISIIMKDSGLIKEPRTINDTIFLKDYSIISMPLNAKYNSNNAIIVSTGSFSPMHEGHVQSMVIAKKYVENMGYNVIQGVMSLSHDAYVSTKNNGIAKKHISERTMLAYEKIDEMKQSDWLKIDRMEGEMVSCAINFSTVLKRIYEYTKYHLNIENLTVFYVFGSDNSKFCNAFINNKKYHALCIDREGYSFNDIKNDLDNFKNIHFLENNSHYKSYSSTEVRKNNIKTDYLKFDENKKIYLIRENGSDHEFNINLKRIFEKYLPKDIEVRLFKTQKYNLKEKTISLDKFIKGEYNIDTSRLFEISSYQKNALKMVSLSQPLDKQLDLIPIGEYNLLDDDSVSGYTINEITKKLKYKGSNVKDIDMLISDHIYNGEHLYDVVDARDFLINTTEHQGLVINNFNNKPSRVPYIFPEVNLTTRASLKAIDQISFSKDICYLNLEYNIDIDILKTNKLIALYNNFLAGE